MSETIKALQAQRAELDAKIEREAEREQARAHVAGETLHERHDGALRVIGAAMEKRLAKMRDAGTDHEDEGDDALRSAMQSAGSAGDYVLAAALCAMLHVRQLVKGA